MSAAHPELGVLIHPDGSVIGKRGAMLSPSDNGLGYFRVPIAGKHRMIHRLVWEAFNGEIPAGLQVDHVDGDKSNNALSNLRLVTASENTARYHKNRALSGKPHSGARKRRQLTRGDVGVIRALLDNGVGRLAIARSYGVTRSCIRHIHNRVTHANA